LPFHAEEVFFYQLITTAGGLTLPAGARIDPIGTYLSKSRCFLKCFCRLALYTCPGQLPGPWQQDPRPLYNQDGGHCMTFRDFDGKLWLSFHHPNGHLDERPMFLPFEEMLNTSRS
jgi:hypothetical protein